MLGKTVLCCLLIVLWSLCPSEVVVVQAQSTAVPTPIRINVGGNTFTDPSGNVWQSDINGSYLVTTTNSMTASHCPRAISSTNLDELYCSYRWFIPPTSQSYRYNIPVTNNFKYAVRLHFAELYYSKIGDRTFNIIVAGVLRTNGGFDILKSSKNNQPNTAFILVTTTKVITDGIISIEFKKILENPALNGIEIIPVVSAVPTAVTGQPSVPVATPNGTIRINVGGDAYTDPATGAIWNGDANGAYLTSTTNSVISVNCPASVATTRNDKLYCSYRYFTEQTTHPHRYVIPVMNNMKYTVRLHFAELYYKNIGQRVFDIYIENQLRVAQFDVLKYAKDNAPNTAYILTTVSQVVTDGHITIEFVRLLEYPMISGIEIIPNIGPSGPVKSPLPVPTKAPVKLVLPPQPQSSPSTWTPYAIRINTGSSVSYTDTNTGKVWLKDNVALYTKGLSKTYGTKNLPQCSVSITNTLEDRIYCTHRYYTAPSSAAQYNVPVRTGATITYDIILHFAEIYYVVPNKRVFSVFVEGSLVVSNLDIYQQVGSNTSFVVSTRQDISDGYVTIDFTSSIGQPFLSAVEVVEMPPISLGPTMPAPIPTPPVPIPAISIAPIITPKFQEILINCGGKYRIMNCSGIKNKNLTLTDRVFIHLR